MPSWGEGPLAFTISEIFDVNAGDVFRLLAGFGLGSIVTAFVQAWMTRTARNEGRSFDERKTAYVGLLEAYHKAAVERTEAAAKQFAYWQVRCDLVAPQSVRDAVVQIVATNDDREGSVAAKDALTKAKRAELGIASTP